MKCVFGTRFFLPKIGQKITEIFLKNELTERERFGIINKPQKTRRTLKNQYSTKNEKEMLESGA